MRKIKLFRIHNNYISDGYDEYSQIVLGNGVSEWEECSDDDLNFIKSNMYQLSKKYPHDSLVIVEQMNDKIPDIIKGIKAEIIKINEEYEARRQEETRKRAEAAEKRAAKKLEKDRRALKKLIQSNPDLIKELANDKHG